MKSEFLITFIDKNIFLSAVEKSGIPVGSRKLDFILSKIEKVYETHIKKVKIESFESDTTTLLKETLTDYLNKSGVFKKNWEIILNQSMKELKYQLLKIVKENKYPSKTKHNYIHHIKIINSFILPKKQTIVIVIRNIETDQVIKYTILIEKFRNIKLTITTKIGVTIFDYGM